MIRCKSCFMIVHDVFQVVNQAKFWNSPNLINTPKSQPHLEDLPFGVRRLIPWIFRIFGIWFPQILRFHFHQIHWLLHSLPRLNFQDLAGFIVASWHLREQLCCRFVELRCLFVYLKSHFTPILVGEHWIKIETANPPHPTMVKPRSTVPIPNLRPPNLWGCSLSCCSPKARSASIWAWKKEAKKMPVSQRPPTGPPWWAKSGAMIEGRILKMDRL